MYNILEQAIIDAKVLREAALKNAETAVLEKYSDEVKGAIDIMLEAETETVEEAIISITPEEEAAEPVLAAAEGENLCGCPDAEEQVEWELSLNDLKAMSEAMPEGEPMEQDALAAEFGAEEKDELALQESETLDEEIDLVFEEEGAKPDFLDLDKDGDKEEPMKAASEDAIDEDIELDEDMVKEIVEELVVDIKPTKSGWAGTPEPIVRHQEEQELARLQGTEAKEENDTLIAAAELLAESKKAVETENEKLKQLIYDLKGKLDESILSNAKLLYTNQTLTSASLNERQKNRIVESIQNADSVEEAKVIFETLQSTAGPSTRKNPKSLSEAISRPSLTVSRRRGENSKRESVVKDRFQALAGIKK